MPQPQRILLAIDSLGFGGAERHVVELAAELAERGHQPTIACSVAGHFADEAAGAGIPDTARRRDPAGSPA